MARGKKQKQEGDGSFYKPYDYQTPGTDKPSRWGRSRQNSDAGNGTGEAPKQRKDPPKLREELFGVYDKEDQESFHKDITDRKAKADAKESEAKKAQDTGDTTGIKDFYNDVSSLSKGEHSKFFTAGGKPQSLQSRIGGQVARDVSRRWIIGGIASTIIGAGASFIVGMLPLQLPFISGVFDIEIGGVRSTVLATRTGRLYSRMFFFDDDGAFSGYKNRGMFATLTGSNIRSNRLINKLRADGFDFTPEMRNGKWTGKFESINGVDYTLDSDASFMDHWRNYQLKRQAVKGFIFDNYNPSVTGWRGRSTRSVYRRLGLNYFRGQFIRDWAGSKLSGYAEKLRFSKIRSRSSTNKTVAIDGKRENVQTEIDPDTGQPVEVNRSITGLEELDEVIVERRVEVNEGRSTGSLIKSIDDGAARAAKKIPGAVLRAVKILGAADALCQAKMYVAMVEAGARTAKRLELIEFDIMLSALANAHLAGEVGSAQNVGDFVTQMKKQNPETGNEFFGSGAWQWVMGTAAGTVHTSNVNKYSVGGGGAGTLGNISKYLGGAITAKACGFVTNPFVQVVSVGVGIVALIGSFGTITAAKAVAQAATTELLLFAAEIFLVPMIIEMFAGTVINGHEWGDEMGAGWVSGRGSSLQVNGGIYGFIPLKFAQFVSIKEEQQRMLALENQTKSFGERFFSVTNHRSVLSNVAMSAHVAKVGGPQKTFSSFMLNPFGSIFGSFSKLPFSRTYAAGPSDQCRDPDIVDNGLVGDPFCNMIMGLPVDTLAIDPVDNLAWMIENGHMDLDGMPISEEYKEYVDKCVNVLDPIHDASNDFDYSFHDYCYAGITDIAGEDGTRRPITPEELAYRQSRTYTFDDLYAYWGVDVDGDGGKAYAQRVGSDPQIFANPMVIQRFNIGTADRSLLCDIYEHINGINTQQLADGTTEGECRSQRLGLEDEPPSSNEGRNEVPGGDGGGNNCGVGGPNECAGITEGTTLTEYNPGGDLTASVPISQSIDGAIIRGCVDIQASGISITNSRILCNDGRDRSGRFNAAIQGNGNTSLVIENNEVMCGTSFNGTHESGIAPCDVGIDASGSIRYNEIHHVVDGINPRSNSVVEYNYIYDLVVEREDHVTWCCVGPYSHADGIQVWVSGASNITIRNNLIEGGSADSVANSLAGIVVTNNTGSSIVIDNNTLTGPMTAARIACWSGVCNITNNEIDVRYSGSSSTITADDASSISKCNRYSDGSLITDAEISGFGAVDNSSCGSAPGPRPPLQLSEEQKTILQDCRSYKRVGDIFGISFMQLPSLPIQRPGCYAFEGIG